MRRDSSVSRYTAFSQVLELGQSVSHIVKQKMVCLLLGRGFKSLNIIQSSSYLKKKLKKNLLSEDPTAQFQIIKKEAMNIKEKTKNHSRNLTALLRRLHSFDFGNVY